MKHVLIIYGTKFRSWTVSFPDYEAMVAWMVGKKDPEMKHMLTQATKWEYVIRK